MITAITEFVASAQPPASVGNIATRAVADCFGAILVGAESEVAVKLRGAVADFGAGQAQIYGTTQELSPPYAAFANAVAGHAWDLDDWEEPGNTHPTVVMLPALLAAATILDNERRPCSGGEMLAAYCVGAEIIMRLGEAVSLSHYERGFHSTATLGAIGTAAAVARMLRLSTDEIGHALGLAVSNATGYTLQFGTHAKALQAGWPARAGLEAACLARQGLTAKPETLISSRGFAGLMGVYDDKRLKRMAGRLGHPWALEEYGLVIKPWSSCGYTHRMMTAALALRPQLTDALDQIVGIHMRIIDFHYKILPYDIPRSRLEALFSLPACTAQILVNGTLNLADSESGFWMDPDVERLTALTRVTDDKAQRPEMNYDPEQPDVLKIALQDGSTLEQSVAYPLGACQNPMSPDQLAAKYAAATRRPAAQFETLLGWTQAEDVNAFFADINHG